MSAPIIFSGSFAKLLKNALRMGSLSADPSSPAAGDIYFNSSSNLFKGHNGSAFITMGTANNTTAIVAKTANYTATNSDSVILCSGSAFTVTLPAATGNSGLILTLRKTDSSLTNIITISRAGADTIEDTTSVTTTTLNTIGETLYLVSDGTSKWYVLDRKIPSVWVADASNIVVTSTGGGVALATSPDTNKVYWRRVGDSMEVDLRYRHTSSTGAATGTGDYLFAIPMSASADTTKYYVNNISTGNGAQDFPGRCGVAAASTPGSNAGKGVVSLYSATQVRFFIDQSTTASAQPVGSGWWPVADSAVKTYSAHYMVPISGWNG